MLGAPSFGARKLPLLCPPRHPCAALLYLCSANPTFTAIELTKHRAVNVSIVTILYAADACAALCVTSRGRHCCITRRQEPVG
jgi:hypothetical protein